MAENRMSLVMYLLLSATFALPVFACEKYIDIPDEQVRRIDAQVRQAKPLDLEAVQNYSKLVCANSAIIRDHARRIGFASTNDTIRAHALLASLLEKRRSHSKHI